MSTRCTIAFDQKDFHLYQECFESDNVYLQLDGDGWAASLVTAAVDWRDENDARPKLGLRIDVSLWRKIVEGWLASEWAENPSQDHKKYDFDPETTNAWLETLKSKKEKSDE
jgi:hypothetical protein